MEFKHVLTFTKRAKEKGVLRVVGATTRKRIHSITEHKILPGDGRAVYPIEMFYGEELVITVSANHPVTVQVSEQSDFNDWCEELARECIDDEFCALGYPPSFVSKEEVRAATTLHFYATLDETFLVCVFNITRKKNRATIVLEHWSKGDEDA